MDDEVPEEELVGAHSDVPSTDVPINKINRSSVWARVSMHVHEAFRAVAKSFARYAAYVPMH